MINSVEQYPLGFSSREWGSVAAAAQNCQEDFSDAIVQIGVTGLDAITPYVLSQWSSRTVRENGGYVELGYQPEGFNRSPVIFARNTERKISRIILSTALTREGAQTVQALSTLTQRNRDEITVACVLAGSQIKLEKIVRGR